MTHVIIAYNSVIIVSGFADAFLNLRKPNPLLPVVVVACLRETTPTFNLQPALELQCTKATGPTLTGGRRRPGRRGTLGPPAAGFYALAGRPPGRAPRPQVQVGSDGSDAGELSFYITRLMFNPSDSSVMTRSHGDLRAWTRAARPGTWKALKALITIGCYWFPTPTIQTRWSHSTSRLILT